MNNARQLVDLAETGHSAYGQYRDAGGMDRQPTEEPNADPS